MLDSSAPPCEARVSPELVRLLAGLPEGSAPRARAGSAPPASGTGRAASGHASHETGWDRVSLRVDGKRPVQFRGAEICTLNDDCPLERTDGSVVRVSRRFRLYLTQDGALIGHVMCDPPAGCAARPLHRMGTLNSTADLARLLQTGHPAACFSVAHAPTTGPALARNTAPHAFAGLS